MGRRRRSTTHLDSNRRRTWIDPAGTETGRRHSMAAEVVPRLRRSPGNKQRQRSNPLVQDLPLIRNYSEDRYRQTDTARKGVRSPRPHPSPLPAEERGKSSR